MWNDLHFTRTSKYIFLATNRYVDLILNNSNLIEYIYTVFRDERVSLNDPIVQTFVEIYFPKVNATFHYLFIYFNAIINNNKFNICFFLQVTLPNLDRIIDSICQTICVKENFEELMSDLVAIKIILQNKTCVSSRILQELRKGLESLSEKFKDEFSALKKEGETRRHTHNSLIL